MTIIRLISRSLVTNRPPFINFESCVRNQIRRHASVLAVNGLQDENFRLRDHRAPKFSHSLEGQFVRNKFKKSKRQDDDEEDVCKKKISFSFQLI